MSTLTSKSKTFSFSTEIICQNKPEEKRYIMETIGAHFNNAREEQCYLLISTGNKLQIWQEKEAVYNDYSNEVRKSVMKNFLQHAPSNSVLYLCGGFKCLLKG